MNIALIGYGKMGKAIDAIAVERGHTITCKISSKNLSELNPVALKWADVAIEFSSPDAALDNVKICLEAGVPVVCGTTGWLNKIKEIHQLCHEKDGAFLHASNFSLGVNIFFKLNTYLAKLMDGFDNYNVNIKEIHHTQKIDSPSGTAIHLADDIIKNIERKKVWTIGSTDKDPNRTIHIDSERRDPVPGTHIVQFTSDIDDISIMHEAKSRAGFAMGAMLAAEWIQGKKGIFSMDDVLEL
ncbi:MAG: 4-hydroxy-tetrahydrodipicolinate reductase [Saprospiraceae bacterium]